MSMKGGSRTHNQTRSSVEETETAPKPLAATLMQEFQNLKDKFKNEDEVQEKGIVGSIVVTTHVVKH